jgi:hypothetical protein
MPMLPMLDACVCWWFSMLDAVSGHALRCVRLCAVLCPPRARQEREFQLGFRPSVRACLGHLSGPGFEVGADRQGPIPKPRNA